MSEKQYVTINEEFRFTSDRHCFILEQFNKSHEITRGKFKGKLSEDKWNEVAYFGNVKDLFNYCVRKFILDANGDLTKIYEKVENIKETINEIAPNLTVKNGFAHLKN